MRIDWTVGRFLLIVVAVLVLIEPASAEEEQPFDVDRWHETLYGSGADPQNGREVLIGLYPGVSGVLGAPEIVSWQANLFLSVSVGSSFSLYLGYGQEWGNPADSQIFTVGWGGVRDLPVVSRQRGFYGKFLRYRRWESDDHGIHHGLSVGTESGVGHLSLAFEFGAARSERDHWMVVAQVSLKVALPIGIPVGGQG